ncbi:MAG: pilus assembly protein TadG-related protein [Acidimicrobiales bacterium]
MRGLRPPRVGPVEFVRAIGSDERGASLAIVAIFLVGMLGLASLVVDIGNGWLSRQRLIPASDAAALAAAQDLVDRPWDEQAACATAGGYVADNAPVATMTECVVTSFGQDRGRITISTSEDFEGLFTDISGEGESVGSLSTAAWGPPLTVSALRPIGLCYDGSAELRDLIDNPRPGPSWVVVHYGKDDPAACGGSAALGNFATIDFEGGTPTYEIRNWMRDGYPGQVGFDPPDVTNCDGGVTCYDRPYASNDIRPELDAVRNSQAYVAFPVFNYVDADLVHLIGMVRARLYAYNFDGLPETWRIELKVDPGLITGTCCGQPGVVAGNKVIAICGVDPEVYLACDPSAAS